MANRIDLVALIPHRLCTTKRGKYPGPELRPYAQVSVDWQRTGANADFWGFGAAGLGDSERLYEIRGMMAGIGEQLGLACLAHHEVSNWMALGMASRHRRIAREMSSRALVELQAHYVLAIGHAMVNLAGRVVALDGDVRSRLVKEFKTDFPPYSNERSRLDPNLEGLTAVPNCKVGAVGRLGSGRRTSVGAGRRLGMEAT